MAYEQGDRKPQQPTQDGGAVMRALAEEAEQRRKRGAT